MYVKIFVCLCLCAFLFHVLLYFSVILQMWVRPDSYPWHDHIPRGALTLGHTWEERHVSPFRMRWVLRFHMRLLRGPSQLDGLVPPRDGDDLQMLGGGLYQSLQHGPGGHLSSFSVLICKTGITQQHPEISWRTWTIRCQNIFIKYLRQGDTGTWGEKKTHLWNVHGSSRLLFVISEKGEPTLLQ